jgi:hypothetical protein
MSDFDLETITWDTIFPENPVKITDELIAKSRKRWVERVCSFTKYFTCCW